MRTLARIITALSFAIVGIFALVVWGMIWACSWVFTTDRRLI